MSPPLVIPYFIPHQGCPHHCVFCNQSVITGRQAPGNLDEIDVLIQDYLSFKGERDRVEFAFFGGNFLGLPESRILELLGRVSPYMDQGVIQRIRCSTRPDTITRKILDLVVPHGLDLVELGVQSMDNHVLERSGRGHTREQTLEAIRLLKTRGLKVGVQVMAGLPGDTMDTALDTARCLGGMSPDLARIYPLLVLAGSKLAHWYASGEYLPLTLDQAVEQTKRMLMVFNGAGVPVIRMGLQAGEMMDDPARMIAGPWHPAFGHLVYSALMFDRACESIDARVTAEYSGKLVLGVHPRSLSRLQGNKKANLGRLALRYPGLIISIVGDKALGPDRVVARLTRG